LSFWLWSINAWVLNYKIPFLYNIFNIIVSMKNYIFGLFWIIKKIKNTENEVALKVNN
jgi:hypothetical protein